MAMIAGGPIGGHVALISLLLLTQFLEKKVCNLSETNVKEISDLLNPFSIYASIAKDVSLLKSGKKYHGNWKKVFFTTFKFLKVGRLCGEFLYGFTPLCDAKGDGAKLWGQSWNQPFPVLFGLSLVPALISVLVGLIKKPDILKVPTEQDIDMLIDLYEKLIPLFEQELKNLKQSKINTDHVVLINS